MKIILLLAGGFEEIEALTVVDLLRRVDIEVDVVSISDENQVIGAHNIKVISDKLIGEIEVDKYDGIVIPGGIPGATNLRDDKKVIEIIGKMNQQNKMIGAICAGPIVLEKAGVIKGKNVTSYPGFEDQLKESEYLEDSVIRDENIITSRGPSFAIDFALEIIRYILGDKEVENLKSDILYEK